MPRALRFAEILADTGVTHGLIGPREVPRLWDRHLLNCAVVAPALGQGPVIDVGSGAGLPGLVVALVRPELEVHLVEPMLRRTTWLGGVVTDLELSNVTVHRGRAQDFWGVLSAPVVTARAVARLGSLVQWCAPLVRAAQPESTPSAPASANPVGWVIAMKGESAHAELAEDGPLLADLGAVQTRVSLHGEHVLDQPVRTIDVAIDPLLVREPAPPRGKESRRRAARRSSLSQAGETPGRAASPRRSRRGARPH